jgi:hypothetical protein
LSIRVSHAARNDPTSSPVVAQCALRARLRRGGGPVRGGPHDGYRRVQFRQPFSAERGFELRLGLRVPGADVLQLAQRVGGASEKPTR